MNMLRRFLLCLWSLVLIAGAAVIGVCAFRNDVPQYWLRKLEILLLSGHFFWWLLLAAVVLLLVGMLGVFVSFIRKAPPDEVIVGVGEGGQVNISLLAVDNVVRKAALSVTGVKDVKSRLKPGSGGVGVGVGLEIVIPHDVSVPETATAVQDAVKNQLQAVAGLSVADVTVLVSNVEGKTI